MANEFKIKHGFISTGDGSIEGGLTITGAGYADNGQRIATRNWATQYLSDNSYATTTDISDAIDALVASAPGTLDTLNELAAALGDDPNFSTTITNSIATKLPLAGGTMSGDIRWTSTGKGLEWVMNTDGAGIKFYNTGDADTNSRLEYYTTDNGNEYHRFMVATNEEMTIKSDGVRVTNNIYMAGDIVATQSWVSTRGYGAASDITAVNTRIDEEVMPLFDTKADIGHTHDYLPLAGGTLTGTLTLNATNPRIDFNGTSDGGIDMSIVATPEGLDFLEPEDGNKIHFQILDDAGVNSPLGYKWNGQSLDVRYAAASHTHPISDIDGLQDELEAKQPAGSYLLTTGKAADSNLLDGLDSSAFVRSNADDTITGSLTISSSSPQLKFNDADASADDFWIHVNSNRFYILPDRDDNGAWDTPYAFILDNNASTAEIYGQIAATRDWVNNNTLNQAEGDARYDALGSANAVDVRITEEVLPAIPTNVSELTNDAGYITDGNTGWNNSYGFITASSTNTLTNKSGNISQWTNDSGYITDGNTNWNNTYGFITGLDWTEIAGDSTNINLSQFTNDVGYITDGNTGWNNTYGFITASDSITGNAATASKLATARNIALSGAVTGNANFDGSGNITIATTATSDPTLTLAGDASGSATFTNLGNATLTVTVANDSHTHDGRYYTESESDARFVNVTGDTVTGDLAISGATLSVTSTAEGTEAFFVDGVNGRLFTISDDLSDSLFSANTISGLPVIEAFADNTVKLGPYSNPVIIDPTGSLTIGGATAATQSYVDTSISNLIGGAPGALDTLNELAAAINDDASYASTVTTALGTKAPLASPALTGNPTAPTQATSNNSTRIATTAFVKAQGYVTTDTNYYLNGITKSGNTLTFAVNGATNQTYTFGSNAFTSYSNHVGLYDSAGSAAAVDTRIDEEVLPIIQTPAITSNGSTPSLNSGISAAEIRTLIGAGTSSSDTNFYLNGITKSGNTLTFSVSGATNQTYAFGSNAFTSYGNHVGLYDTVGTAASEAGAVNTRIDEEVLPLIPTVPSNVSAFTNDAGYITDGNTNWNNSYGFITDSVTDFNVADQIIHTGDTNTYMQFHAADQWRVVTGGGERLEVNNSQVTVQNALHVNGDILLTGTATSTNQGRMIDFTGFDKEGTTDFTDRAYIQHTTNTGGHAGSVLVISSQNDSGDGIAFLTNGSSKLKHNSNNIATEAWVQDQGYITSAGANYYVDGLSFDTGNGILTASVNGTTNQTVDLDGRYQLVGSYLTTTGKAADSDKLDGLDSGAFLRSNASDTATGVISFNAGINTLSINDTSGQQLVICAGEAGIDSSQTGELVYVNAENGFQVAASNDNWATGYAGTKKTIIDYGGIRYDGNYVWHAGNFNPSSYQAAGTYNTIIGTDSDINTSGSTIIDNIYVTDGVITSMGTRTLTAADLGIYKPEPPVVAATNIVGETIEVVFEQSPTPNIDYYQVWSSVDGGSYGMISQIPRSDIAATMTVIDASFSVTGTIAYRVYAVSNGIYSDPAAVSQAFATPTLDVVNLSVVNLNTAYYIQYDMPDSRFVDHIEIYMDSEASSGSLSRTGASLIYSGDNTNYMYQISSSALNNYHQFWVEVVES